MNYEQNLDMLPSGSTGRYKTKGLSYTFLDQNYVEPVTVEEFKEYAGIDYNSDDALISTFLKASRTATERHLEKSLGVREVRVTALEYSDMFRLSYTPVASFVSGETDLEFSADDQIILKGGTNLDLRFITDDSFVNPDIVTAILMLALNYYDERGRYLSRFRETGELVDKWKIALRPYKLVTFP